MELFNVAIIGLGNIGYLYDRDLPQDEFVKTHFRAFSLHNKFRIVGCVESNSDVRTEVEYKFSVPCYETISNIVDSDIDVFVVSTPTCQHMNSINQILKRYKPKVILCEKPLSTDIKSALKIVEECHRAGVTTYVNYIRRADPAIKYLYSCVKDGKFKMPFRAIIQYSNGILHNGSHFLDLLYHLFGEGKIISAQSIIDSNNPDAIISFKNGFATLSSTLSKFNLFAFKIIFENGVFEYLHDGSANWIECKSNLAELDFDKKQQVINNAKKYQLLIVDELYKALKLQTNSLCLAEDAFRQHVLINEIINHAI